MTPAQPSAQARPATSMAGTSVVAPGLAQDFLVQRRRQTRTIAVVTLLCAVVAVLFGLKMSGALRLGASIKSPKVLTAQGDNGSPQLLTATGNTAKPVMASTAVADARMPDDVRDYLEHIHKCEQKKIEISGDQMAEAVVLMQKMQALGAGMGLMDPYDQSDSDNGDKTPTEYTKGKMMDFRPKWDELIQFFQSKTPPTECQPLANDFGRSLNEIPGMMGDLGEILNSASSNPQSALEKVQKMKNGSYSDIDRYFARADEKLGQICDKYHEHKWFNIKSDVASGGIMGKVGGL